MGLYPGALPSAPARYRPPHTSQREQAGAVPTLAPRLPSCTSAVLPAARSRSSQLGTAMAAAPSRGNGETSALLPEALPARPSERGPARARPRPRSVSGPSPLRLRPLGFRLPLAPPGTAARFGGLLAPDVGGLETFTARGGC